MRRHLQNNITISITDVTSYQKKEEKTMESKDFSTAAASLLTNTHQLDQFSLINQLNKNHLLEVSSAVDIFVLDRLSNYLPIPESIKGQAQEIETLAYGCCNKNQSITTRLCFSVPFNFTNLPKIEKKKYRELVKHLEKLYVEKQLNIWYKHWKNISHTEEQDKFIQNCFDKETIDYQLVVGNSSDYGMWVRLHYSIPTRVFNNEFKSFRVTFSKDIPQYIMFKFFEELEELIHASF